MCVCVCCLPRAVLEGILVRLVGRLSWFPAQSWTEHANFALIYMRAGSHRRAITASFMSTLAVVNSICSSCSNACCKQSLTVCLSVCVYDGFLQHQHM